MTYRDEHAVGLAGEFLVCADLLALGHLPLRTEQAAPYDIAVDVGDRIVRVQVKTQSVARPYPQAQQRHVTGYTWSMRHGKTRNYRAYAVGAVDGFALVALDQRRIAYVRPGRQVFQIPVSGHVRTTRCFEDFPFEALL